MNYNDENSKMFESYVKRNFLKKNNEINSDEEAPHIELILTSKCDLKCKYCYINNYRDKLYPQHLDKKDIILNNLRILLDYLSTQKYVFHLEIFSGEVFAQDVGYEALDIIYEYALKNNGMIKSILIPTNMTFLNSEEKIKKIEDIYEKFESILIPIHLSCSFDGPLLLENRSFCSNKENRYDEYCDKLFKFAKKHHIGLHPMLSAYGIEKWPDNYDWFIEKIKEYKLGGEYYLEPMMLEVRNDDWTDEKIEYLLKFYDHLFERLIDKFGSKEKLIEALYGPENKTIFQYCNIKLDPNVGNNKKISCAIQSTLHVRMGDLAVVLCHRLGYDELVPFKFKVEDNKIEGFEALSNPALYLTVKSIQNTCLPKCSNCRFNEFCAKGCFGAQYEKNKDLFYPLETVCKMFTAKYNYLIDKYNELELFPLIYQYLCDEEKRYFDEMLNYKKGEK